MGWKSIKQEYRITHTVHVTDAGICIGSGHIHNLIVITAGKISKRMEGYTGNPDLTRYLEEMDADSERLQAVAMAEDVFDRSLPVYTYYEGSVIKEECEEYGYPNVTHRGNLMYENTYSESRDQAKEWAASDASSTLRMWNERVAALQKDLEAARARQQAWGSHLIRAQSIFD